MSPITTNNSLDLQGFRKVIAAPRRARFFQKIDAAVIVTPAPTHFEMCREPLQMGKDVFVQKPITLVSNEAKKLTELAEESGTCPAGGTHLPLRPSLAMAKGGYRGEPIWPAQNVSRAVQRLSNVLGMIPGSLADSIHFYRSVQLFPRSAAVARARSDAGFFEPGVDDESLLVMQYGKGSNDPMFATIEAGYHTPGRFRELTVVGADSSAVCDYNVAQYKIKTFENRHVAENGENQPLEGTMHQLEFPPEEPLRAELAAFIDSIEKRTPSPVDGWMGFDAVRLVEAALDSARTGAWIDISNE